MYKRTLIDLIMICVKKIYSKQGLSVFCAEVIIFFDQYDIFFIRR